LHQIGDFGLAACFRPNKNNSSSSSVVADDKPENERWRTDNLPVRWTAPEALMYKTIAPECDVWSFGVFLMEVFTDGVTPYQELANDEILDRVCSQRFMTIAIIFFAIDNNKPATFLFCECSR
jgi:serine/threonine protein kinase